MHDEMMHRIGLTYGDDIAMYNKRRYIDPDICKGDLEHIDTNTIHKDHSLAHHDTYMGQARPRAGGRVGGADWSGQVSFSAK